MLEGLMDFFLWLRDRVSHVLTSNLKEEYNVRSLKHLLCPLFASFPRHAKI